MKEHGHAHFVVRGALRSRTPPPARIDPHAILDRDDLGLRTDITPAPARAWKKLKFEGQLTPDIAERFLRKQTRGGPDERVRRYAEDIHGGRWRPGGKVQFNVGIGQLEDGWHRCQAVVLARIPIPVIFILTQVNLAIARAESSETALSLLAVAARGSMEWASSSPIARSRSPSKEEIIAAFQGRPSLRGRPPHWQPNHHERHREKK